jgi:hypothetical protein
MEFAQFITGNLAAFGIRSEQATVDKLASQSKRTSMKSGGGSRTTIAGEISLDRVLEVSVRTFSGHVYNLQTNTGWYIASNNYTTNGDVHKGIIAHNCYPVPVTKTWAELGYPDIPEMVQPKITGVEAFNQLSQAEQMSILGRSKYLAWVDGQFTLPDLIGRKYNPVWGWMHYERSLRELGIDWKKVAREAEL